MMTLMKLSEDIFDKVWGFKPTREVKPIHFANEFVRYICNKEPDIEKLHNAAAQYRNGKTRITNQQLLEDIKKCYVIRDKKTNKLNSIKEIRSALDLVLNQDRAVFNSERHSSYTLTHHDHVTGDISGQSTGKFIGQLIIAMENNESIKKIRKSFDSEKDNTFLLTYPLLNKKKMGAIPPINNDVKQRIENSKILQNIQTGFKNITNFESSFEKTIFIQRLITFGMFSIYLHLINANNRGRDNFVPIVLTGKNKNSKIREASRSCFSRASKEVKRAFENELALELKARGQYDLEEKNEYINLMKEWLSKFKSESPKEYKELLDTFEHNFNSMAIKEKNYIQSFIAATVETSFSRLNKTPLNFIKYIGTRLGLVYPRKGGRGRRYYLPSPKFIDMLVMVLFDKNEEITLKEFFKRAFENYGILCGAFPNEENKFLREEWNVMQITSDDLEMNYKDIKRELIQMGYVQEFSDGIAIISPGGF